MSLACNYLLFVSLQEEERKKRQELEAIMEENNKKIEEAQRKLVSLLFMWVFFKNFILVDFCHLISAYQELVCQSFKKIILRKVLSHLTPNP